VRARAGSARVVGDADFLEHVRFVITLDTDTSLPRDAARELIGTLGHPLNQPVYEPRLGRIAEGYGIIQPRVGPSITSAARSPFAQLFAGEPGIDPYTRAVSDVYQDAFGEGSFIGKGIYDVDAFERALGARFPENRILSHDLVEGTYARAGLATDIVLYEEEPSSYLADVARRQRWIRGDWQIAAWLFPKVPGPTRRLANPLSALSRWKIFDNLRRSVVPAGELALLALASWLGVPTFAVAAVAGAHLVPPVLHFVASIVRGAPPEIPLTVHARHATRATRGPIVQGFFSLACLPYEALYATAAIVRTWFRLAITRRRLLEWTTAGKQSAAYARPSAGSTARCGRIRSRASWHSLSCAIRRWRCSRSPGSSRRPSRGGISRPFDASGPASRRRGAHSSLRSIARRDLRVLRALRDRGRSLAPAGQLPGGTVGAARASDVPPRTSGSGSLSELAAYDLGYQSHGRFVERVDRTLATLDRLERYEGHFLNWYDTATLRPLGSHYVSTVDSGNLVACFLVLAAGAEEMVADPLRCAPRSTTESAMRSRARRGARGLGERSSRRELGASALRSSARLTRSGAQSSSAARRA
jgi:hypothetical protein